MLLAGARQLEGIAHDPVAAAPGEHRLLHRHLVFGALEKPAADRGIFALVVLAHDVEIDVARRAVLERRVDPGQEPHRAQIDVLLKLAPQRDQQAPQRHMVGHPGIADGAQKHRIERAQLVDPVLRHHPPGLGIGLAAPVEFAPFELEAIAPGRRFHDRDAFRHHFAPDAVPGNHRDPIAVRHAIPPLPGQLQSVFPHSGTAGLTRRNPVDDAFADHDHRCMGAA